MDPIEDRLHIVHIRKIQHAINKARNAIYAAGKPGHAGCGILDTDLIAAFDYLCLDWVFKVLEQKGLDPRVIARYKNLYEDNHTVVVVNSIPGKSVKNIRISETRRPSQHAFLQLWDRSTANLS